LVLRHSYRERDPLREQRFFDLLLLAPSSGAASGRAAFECALEARLPEPRDSEKDQAGPIIIRVLRSAS
jgi:hypothetical protein